MAGGAAFGELVDTGHIAPVTSPAFSLLGYAFRPKRQTESGPGRRGDGETGGFVYYGIFPT